MPTMDEKNTFSSRILEICSVDKLTCIEAIVEHCEKMGLEIEVASTLVNDVLKSKLYEEAQTLRYIERTSRLPV